jgi:hypothetical protein
MGINLAAGPPSFSRETAPSLPPSRCIQRDELASSAEVDGGSVVTRFKAKDVENRPPKTQGLEYSGRLQSSPSGGEIRSWVQLVDCIDQLLVWERAAFDSSTVRTCLSNRLLEFLDQSDGFGADIIGNRQRSPPPPEPSPRVLQIENALLP